MRVFDPKIASQTNGTPTPTNRVRFLLENTPPHAHTHTHTHAKITGIECKTTDLTKMLCLRHQLVCEHSAANSYKEQETGS